jgi:hypothetical protein
MDNFQRLRMIDVVALSWSRAETIGQSSIDFYSNQKFRGDK